MTLPVEGARDAPLTRSSDHYLRVEYEPTMRATFPRAIPSFAALLFIGLGLALSGAAGSASAQTAEEDRSCAPVCVYTSEEVTERDLTVRDARLLTMRHTDRVYHPEEPASRAAWMDRAEKLRRQVLVSAGLWPRPEKTPLNPRIFGRVEGDGYTVEKVHFESYPGFLVAGNLYRPRGKEGPFPAVLAPHGHWPEGRIHDTERGSVPARAINLARQGYVVLAWDMVGYGDTRQVGHDFAADSLSSMWGINLLGLQLRNSLRTLDLVRSLPEVDTSRIGITGASGGATQTFLLTAVERGRRIDVSAPVNMISVRMQGGSLCENAPGLRLGTNNVELGALTAPRPMLMVANTHDWTVSTPTVEYPAMQRYYELFGAGDRLELAYFDFPHNYNRASRNAMYPFFARHLKGAADPASYREQPYEPLEDEELLVFLKKAITDPSRTYDEIPDSLHRPLPTEMDAAALTEQLKDRWRGQLESYWPSDSESRTRFEHLYGTGYRHVMAAEVPEKTRVIERGTIEGPGFTGRRLLIARESRRDWIPAVLLSPETATASATLLLTPGGKRGAFQRGGEIEPRAEVRALLDRGHAVLAIDPFGTGEHVLPEGAETPRDPSTEHFTTFNRTSMQEQVQDVLTAASYLEDRPGVEHLSLLGLAESGLTALLAAPLAEDLIDRTAAAGLDLPEIRNDDETAPLRYFVPGLLRLGGLRTAAALTAPHPLYLSGRLDRIAPDRVAETFEISGAPGALRTESASSPAVLAEWLDR